MKRQRRATDEPLTSSVSKARGQTGDSRPTVGGEEHGGPSPRVEQGRVEELDHGKAHDDKVRRGLERVKSGHAE